MAALKVLITYKVYPDNPQATALSKEKEMKKGRLGTLVGFILFMVTATLAGGVILPLGDAPMLAFLPFAIAVSIGIPVILEFQRSDRFNALIESALKLPLEQRSDPKAPKVTKITCAIIAILFALFLVVTISFKTGQSKTYADARAMLEAGDYAAAATAFESLKDYQDAKKQANEAKRLYALQLADEGEYDQALRILDKLTGNDAKRDKQDVQKRYDAVRQVDFDKATALHDAGQYLEAAELFETLKHFQYADSRAQENYMLAAEEAMDAENYADAAIYFEKAGNWHDSPKRRVDALKALANSVVESGDLVAAIEAYERIEGDEEAAESARELRYIYAGDLLASGKTEDAYQVYTTIDDYRDVADIIQNSEALRQASTAMLDVVGSKIYFGNWEQDGDATNGAEAIRWTVIDVEEDYSVLLADQCLAARPYATENLERYLWTRMDLRAWLNDHFWNQAFTAAEQEQIVPCEGTLTVGNDPRQLSSIKSGKNYNYVV